MPYGKGRIRSIALIILAAGLYLPRSWGAYPPNVKEAIEVIVLFCVAGGEEYKISGGGEVEGGLALKKFGVTAGGEIRVSKSEAKGLVEGLRHEMSQIAGEQASQARECMKPYIDRIVDILLGKVTEEGTRSPSDVAGIWSYYDPALNREICKLELKKDGTYTKTTPMGNSGFKTTPGRWRYNDGLLELLFIQRDGQVDSMERGRVAAKRENVVEYTVIDGYEPAGKPGQVYELRRQ